MSPRRRSQFIVLLVLTLGSSVAEIVSLGAVVPFIAALTDPEQVRSYAVVAWFVDAVGARSPVEIVWALSVAFAAAQLLSGGFRLVVLWFSLYLANATGADLSIDVYRRTLYQPYAVHVARNSNEIISGITQKIAAATAVLISLITVVTSAALFAAIVVTLILIDPAVALFAMVSFGLGYGAIAVVTRRRLVRNGECIAREQTRVVKALQEGLGAIRDVLLDGTQRVYCAVYRTAVEPLQRAQSENSFINQAPRFAMEAVGAVMITGLAMLLSGRPGGVGGALPVLAALALGAQRLLPLMQQLYGNWTVVAGNRASLLEVLSLLDQPLPTHADEPSPDPLVFRDRIAFDRVSFRYTPDSPWVLRDVSFEIPRGARIGVVGATGSGKSTALDLLMALLTPTDGIIRVDGESLGDDRKRAWQRTLAHVPQSLFLADATIAENIAFGVPPPAIDMDAVRQAAVRAQIMEFVESRPGGFRAIVGERGIRISGGQRQRIGIARALYKRASVLVFDEATSALDTETEQAVMQAIDGLDRDLTIVIIAHRLATLRNCDTIIRLDGGRVVGQGPFERLVDARPVEAAG